METIYTVVGKMLGNFNDDKTGKKVEYARIYAVYDPEDAEGATYDGQAVEIFKVRPELLDGVEIGDSVTVYYNKFGKVSGIIPVES